MNKSNSALSFCSRGSRCRFIQMLRLCRACGAARVSLCCWSSSASQRVLVKWDRSQFIPTLQLSAVSAPPTGFRRKNSFVHVRRVFSFSNKVPFHHNFQECLHQNSPNLHLPRLEPGNTLA